MTTTAPPASAAPSLGTPGPAAFRLLRSEYLKLRTINVWWLFLLGALIMLALAILINWVGADFAFTQEIPDEVSAEDAVAIEASRNAIFQAANLYTSGQFFGLMIVLLLGVIVITNEFQHQTVTATFLTTPHRTAVILAKLVMGVLLGLALWAISFAINVPATIGILSIYDQPHLLGEWAVQRSILLNLLAYALWGILGIGLGVLIRSQIGATITGALLYLLGTAAVAIVVELLRNRSGWEWVEDAQYAFPSVASGLMVQGTSLPGQPPYWVGAVVLIGWGVLTAIIGTLIIRRRDIS
jgi:ABC-type transport system involved in multi-copper enzyme maturation permease subunit